MSIQVRCNSILRYDQENGKYIRCQHSFSLPDSSAGLKVKCPQCDHLVTAPSPKLESLDLAEEEISLAPDLSVSDEAADLEEDSSLPQLAALDDDAWSDISDREKVGPSSIKAADDILGSPLAPPEPTPQVFCPHCSAPLASELALCKECGYHVRLGRPVKGLVGVDPDDAPTETGLRLWMTQQLSEGESLGKVFLISWISVSLLLLLFISLLILINGLWLALLLGPMWLIAVTISGILIIRWAFNIGDSPAQVTALTVTVARLCGWREWVWPFRSLKLKDLRGAAIDDDELADLEELKTLEVLDLESSKITDAGLSQLSHLPKLRCLVVRRTRVTDEGVAALEKKLPNLWVWR